VRRNPKEQKQVQRSFQPQQQHRLTKERERDMVGAAPSRLRCGGRVRGRADTSMLPNDAHLNPLISATKNRKTTSTALQASRRTNTSR